MKFKFGTRGFALLAIFLFTATAFTICPVNEVQLADNQPQKKVQRIKVMVSSDGKTTTIDTTFNLKDEKMAQLKVDSILKKVQIDVNKTGKASFFTYGNGPKVVKAGKNTNGNIQGVEQFEVVYQSDDSTKSNENRVVCFGNNGKYGFTISSDSLELGRINHFGIIPPPPPPPLSSISGFQINSGNDPFSFDTKDPSIISYEKKDIGKGLEKITIIRKKKD